MAAGVVGTGYAGTDLVYDHGAPGISTKELAGNPWKAFFGEPSHKVDIDPYMLQKTTTWTLPEAYRGSNEFLGQKIDRRVFEDTMTWTLNRVMPIKRTDELSVTWRSIIFEPQMPQIVPELGIVRYVSARKEAGQAALVQRGQGLYLEHGFMNTAEGRMVYMEMLRSIAMNFLECMQMNVIISMQTAFVNLLRQQRYYENRYGDQALRVLKHEKDTWGVLQTVPHALEVATTTIREVMRTRQKKANTLILPPETTVYLAYVPKEKTEYRIAGQAGPDRIRDGPEAITNVNGMDIFQARLFQIQGEHTQNPMNTVCQIGGFHYANVLRGADDFYQGYTSREQNVNIIDFDRDTFVEIALRDMLYNCHRFDPETGNVIADFPIRHDSPVYPRGCPEEDQDPFIGHDGLPAPAFLGQMSNTRKRMHMRTWKFTTMGRAMRNNIVNANEVECLSRIGSVIYKMDSLRMTAAVAGFLIAQADKANDHDLTGVDLETLGGVPAGFQSWDGIRTIAEAENTNANLRENCTFIVQHFPGIVTKLKRICPDSPIFKDNLAHAGLGNRLSELDAVFEGLVTPTRVRFFKTPADAGAADNLLHTTLIAESTTTSNEIRNRGGNWGVLPQIPQFDFAIEPQRGQLAKWLVLVHLASLLNNSANGAAVFQELMNAYQNEIRGNEAEGFGPFVDEQRYRRALGQPAEALRAVIHGTYQAIDEAATAQEHGIVAAVPNPGNVQITKLVVSPYTFRAIWNPTDNAIRLVPGDPRDPAHPLSTPAAAGDATYDQVLAYRRFYHVGVPLMGEVALRPEWPTDEVAREHATNMQGDGAWQRDTTTAARDAFRRQFLFGITNHPNFRRAMVKISEDADAATRMLAHFFLFTPITLPSLDRLITNNIPFPFAFILARPHQRFLTAMMIACWSGSEMGNMYVREGMFELGDDVNVRAHVATYTGYFSPVIYQPGLIYIVPHAYCQRYISGNGTKWFELNRYDPTRNLFGSADSDQDGSMFSFIVPDAESLPIPFSVTGRLTLANTVVSGKLSYPTAVYYDRLWGFSDAETLFQGEVNTRNFYDVDDTSPPALWRNFTLKWHNQKGGWGWKDEETGHRKSGTTYPGCRAIWDGQLTAPDWERGKFPNADDAPFPQRVNI